MKIHMYICDNFQVMHLNIQSTNGRLSSLEATVNSLDIDIAVINEMNLKGNKKLEVNGYTSLNKNRKNSNMGGVATLVKNEHSITTFKVCEGEKIECIVTRHGQFSPAINLVNVYGSQESRLSVDEVREEWEEIL